MDSIAHLLADPAAWAAFITLVVMEVVLGIDNLIFISILTNKLPEHQRPTARRIGISLALIMRIALLSTIAIIVGLTAPLFDLGLVGAPDSHGYPSFETAFSWRDLILIAGGLFLVWKATKEIHHNVDPTPTAHVLDQKKQAAHVPIMVAAVLVAVTVMLLAADPVANFIHANPTVVMLALGFLLMIGMVLIAEGFGVHVPKGYIYAAMAFSALVEGLNMLSRNAQKKKAKAQAAPAQPH